MFRSNVGFGGINMADALFFDQDHRQQTGLYRFFTHK